jgi:hypothetical protein
MPGWPSDAEWAGLKAAVGGRLSPVNPPDFNDAAIDKLLGDPFYLGDQPGLTENSGWLDPWRSVPSAYVVAAESTADVAAAIDFARAHKVRLVIRGGGPQLPGNFHRSRIPDDLDSPDERHHCPRRVHAARLQRCSDPRRIGWRRVHLAAPLPGRDRRAGAMCRAAAARRSVSKAAGLAAFRKITAPRRHRCWRPRW